MDVTESELTIALQEAFTCYLAFLSHTQKLRESRLPRSGKAVETTADVSTQQDFQSRVAGIEACLQYTGKIARRVRNWVNYPPEDHNDEGVTVETEVVSFETLEGGHDVPYLDFFSGCWVQPVTPFSAGPSNNIGEADLKQKEAQTSSQPETRHPPQLSREDQGEYIPDTKGRGYNLDQTSSRASLGIHPNAPISVSSKSVEQFYSAPSSVALSTNRTTPASSSDSVGKAENEVESPPDDEEDSEDEEEYEDGDDTASVTSEIAKAFYLQQTRNADDAQYAQRIHTAEEKQAQEEDRRLAEAKRLAEQVARVEEARLVRQKKYAEDLAREEREKEERRRRDREAAVRAQKEQEQWELQAIARETAAMRAEERKRREEVEAKRVAEQERRLKIERERQWAEEFKQRQHSVEKEKRRKEADDSRRRQREREKRETTIQIDCLACMEPGEKKDMVILPCKHAYCGDCIKDAFKSAYKSRFPFKCCGTSVSTKTPLISRYISPSFLHKYSTLLLELSTPHPKYCSSPTCSRFLPPSQYHLPTITCHKCRTRTCTSCTQAEHAGVCAKDKDGIRVEKLAKRKGWKQCPGCSQVVERTEGCLHITCRCGAEWCYACLREWGECGSACGRGARIGGVGEGLGGGEGRVGGAERVIPLVAMGLFMAMARSR